MHDGEQKIILGQNGHRENRLWGGHNEHGTKRVITYDSDYSEWCVLCSSLNNNEQVDV
jgi:hypothetical protein